MINGDLQLSDGDTENPNLAYMKTRLRSDANLPSDFSDATGILLILGN